MAIKDPDLDHPIEVLIAKRWSPCVFADKAVEQEILCSLFEAARWAPSCYNEQPWNWVIGFKGTREFDNIASLLVEANQAWAKSAPVLGISVARTYFEKNSKPNRHALHDVGLAMGLLCIQATAQSLYVHQMAGFRYEDAPKVLQLPKGHEAVAAFGIGYLGDPENAPDALKTRDTTKRARRKISELVHIGTWGKNG